MYGVPMCTWTSTAKAPGGRTDPAPSSAAPQSSATVSLACDRLKMVEANLIVSTDEHGVGIQII